MINNPYKIRKLLLKSGWSERKGQTSHAVFSKHGFKNIIVPMHKGKDLSRNYVFDIQKKAGIKLA